MSEATEKASDDQSTSPSINPAYIKVMDKYFEEDVSDYYSFLMKNFSDKTPSEDEIGKLITLPVALLGIGYGWRVREDALADPSGPEELAQQRRLLDVIERGREAIIGTVDNFKQALEERSKALKRFFVFQKLPSLLAWVLALLVLAAALLGPSRRENLWAVIQTSVGGWLEGKSIGPEAIVAISIFAVGAAATGLFKLIKIFLKRKNALEEANECYERLVYDFKLIINTHAMALVYEDLEYVRVARVTKRWGLRGGRTSPS